MSIKNYLVTMEREVSHLSAPLQRTVLKSCEEKIDQMRAQGKSEEEILAVLDSPEALADQLVAVYQETLPSSYQSMSNQANKAGRIAAVVSFNLVFASGIAGGLFGGFVGLWGGALGLLLALPASIVMTILESVFGWSLMYLPGFVNIIISIGASIGGFFAVKGMTRLSKWAGKLVKRYIDLNRRFIKGEKLLK